MNKTKIEWCDRTWNPVTGCLHNCPYCYAKKIAERFAKQGDEHCHDCTQPIDDRLREQRYKHGDSTFRYGFTPTFHPYRLQLRIDLISFFSKKRIRQMENKTVDWCLILNIIGFTCCLAALIIHLV